jgi:glycosyltransferase involved in cell wall biosynthesis
LYIVSDDRFFRSHRLPLALAAVREGYDVAIASPPHDDTAFYAACGIRHCAIPLRRDRRTAFGEARAFLGIANVIWRYCPDVVHLVTARPILYGGITCRLLRIRTISAITGLGYAFIHNDSRTRRLRRIMVAAYRHAIGFRDNHIIFQNEDDLAIFRTDNVLGRASWSIVRGSGVDLERIKPRPLPEGRTVLVLPARMLRDKGVCEFVAAARILRKRGVEATFRLVGDPDDANPTSLSRDELLAWVNEGIVEWQPHTHDIGDVLGQSHVVVLPSYREGFPKTLIDAAAAGRACATTDVPGCRDAVVSGVTGELFRPRDAEDMARVLEPLILDRGRQAVMGKAARRHAEAAFDVRETCRAHLRLYDAMTKHVPVPVPDVEQRGSIVGGLPFLDGRIDRSPITISRKAS